MNDWIFAAAAIAFSCLALLAIGWVVLPFGDSEEDHWLADHPDDDELREARP